MMARCVATVLIHRVIGLWERVLLSDDLPPVSFRECGAHAPLFLQDFRVPAVEALEQARGALDVGEEEGDRPGRQAGRTRPPT